jgi:acetyltransferase-like isoleucine patch superfamily enzyme
MNNAQYRIIENWASIWENTNIWNFTHIRSTAKIWNNCNIWNNVYIDTWVIIWNNVKIQNWVNAYNWLEIADDVFVWPSVTFTNDLYPRAFIWGEDKISKTIIEKWVSIWANATIKCWITVWEYALIWAGTMVTKDIPPYSLVVWNPWRVIWKVDKNLNKIL